MSSQGGQESPFKISITDAQISLLQQKLALSIFPDELEGANRTYGAPLADVKRLINRWKDGYDWKKHEAALNEELPQFTRDIEVDSFGILNIHYVHKKSKAESAIPLLFVHGCKRSVIFPIPFTEPVTGPGSFIEVRKILPLLNETSTSHPSFHVVALSLPGFGFSEAPTKKGFDSAHYAEVCRLFPNMKR